MNEPELEKPKIAMTKIMITRPGRATVYFFTYEGATQWLANARAQGKDTTGWLLQPAAEDPEQ